VRELTLLSLQDVLHDVPDFEERKRLLSELKNRLEALLSPRLISAFQTHSLPEAQRYVVIFKEIKRYPQLKNYYVGCHKVSTTLHAHAVRFSSGISPCDWFML
jgi:hypothetical protein